MTRNTTGGTGAPRSDRSPHCSTHRGDDAGLDPFARLPGPARSPHREALLAFARRRDGAVDLEAQTLARRERFFATLAAAPVRTRRPPDADAFRAGQDGPAPADADRRLLFALACAKANRGEAYGVELEIERFARDHFQGVDTGLVHLALQERYHTRLLEAACDACGVEMELRAPPPPLRLLVRAMNHLPDGLRFLPILCGESVGAAFFDALHDACDAFDDEPEVAERLRTLVRTIWTDELSHVAYCRARVHPWLLPLGRALRPLVARVLVRQLPEFAALAGGRRALLRRAAGPLRRPEELAWSRDAERPRPRAPRAPGPRLAPLALARFVRDPLAFTREATRRHGDVVRLGFGGFYLVSHPDHVQHVLQDHAERYWKGRKTRDRSGPIFGRGILLDEGESWRRRRRGMAPAFAARAVAGHVPAMVAETARCLDAWQAVAGRDAVLDVKEEMRRLTQDVLTATLLGGRVGEDDRAVGRAMAELGRYTDASLRSPLPLPPPIPTPRNRRMKRAVACLDHVVERLVAEHRRAPRDNLLGRLVDAQGPGEAAARQVRDDLTTLFIAGHETTANTLSWTLALLARHPEARRRLVEEVDRELGGRPPDAETLPRLVYTDAVIRESMRLYPLAWILARENFDEDELGGHRIPAGSTVLLCPWVTHRRPDFWEQPDTFAPERFLEGSGRRQRHPFAWFPFGGGGRFCLGYGFVQAEARVVLAAIHQRYRLELALGAEVRPDPKMTLEPAGRLAMQVFPREPARVVRPPSRAHRPRPAADPPPPA